MLIKFFLFFRIHIFSNGRNQAGTYDRGVLLVARQGIAELYCQDGNGYIPSGHPYPHPTGKIFSIRLPVPACGLKNLLIPAPTRVMLPDG